MALYYYYGDVTTEGITIEASIATSIYDLETLIRNLQRYNMVLLSFNTQGVVVDYESTHLSTLERYREETHSKLLGHLTRLDMLESKVNNNQIAMDFKNAPVEVPEGFYILYDMLPEKIKKELKIYIHKK